MVRTIKTEEVTKVIKEMCIEANHYLSDDMKCAMNQAMNSEESALGKKNIIPIER